MQKIIRDKIPEMAKASGIILYTQVIKTDKAFLYEGCRTLLGQAGQYSRADKRHERLEELTDILEMVYALAAADSCSNRELNQIREQRAYTHGTFDGRTGLVGIDNGQ